MRDMFTLLSRLSIVTNAAVISFTMKDTSESADLFVAFGCTAMMVLLASMKLSEVPFQVNIQHKRSQFVLNRLQKRQEVREEGLQVLTLEMKRRGTYFHQRSI